MTRLNYDFEQFPKSLQSRIKDIAEQRNCSVDEVIEGLWDSFLNIMKTGEPDLIGLAKELQKSQPTPRATEPCKMEPPKPRF